jgi:hypothetical protein
MKAKRRAWNAKRYQSEAVRERAADLNDPAVHAVSGDAATMPWDVYRDIERVRRGQRVRGHAI